MDFLKNFSFRLPFREDALFSILFFLVLVVPLALTLNTFEHYEVIKFTLMLILLGWAILTWLHKRPVPLGSEDNLPASKKIVYHPVFFWVLGLFWVWALLSTLTSLDIGNSIFGFYPRFSSGLLFYTAWMLCMVLLVQVLTAEKYKSLVRVLIFDSFLISIVGILQSYGIAFYQGLTTEPFQRAPSLLGNPNFSTMFTAMVAPLVCVFLIEGKTLVSKIYYGLVFFAIAASCVVLSSRGSLAALYAALFVSLALVLFIKNMRRFAWSFFAGLAVLMVLNFSFFHIARPGAIAGTVSLTETNVQLRFLTWQTGLRALQRNPVLGSGPGNFQISFERQRDNVLSAQSGIFDDAHNIFLHIAVTLGLPGVLLFLTLMLYPLWMVFRFIRLGSADPLDVGNVAGVAAFAIAGSFTPVALPCFLIVGVLLAGIVYRNAKQVELNMEKITTAVFSVAGVMFILLGLSLITSEFLFFKGYEEYKYAANPGPAYRYTNLAVRVNPSNPLFFLYRTRSEIALLKNEDQIVAQVEKDKALNPTTAYAYERASTDYFLLYKETGKEKYFDLSVKNMMQTFKVDKFYAARYGRLGYFYYSAGKPVTSKELVKVSLTLDNTYLPSWLLLAKIYQQQGNKEAMVYSLTQAQKVRPDIKDLGQLLKAAQKVSDIRLLPIPVVPQMED